MTDSALPHSLTRSLEIGARLETVFRYFTESPAWASWWGAGSTIDARPGGALLIRHPNGVEVVGEVLEIAPPRRIVFSYGYAADEPIARGGSRVTIELSASDGGTRLELCHEFAEGPTRDHHVQGWRYQLSLFANVVADALHADAEAKADAWFACWSEPEGKRRRETLARVVAESVRFRDRFSAIAGRDELAAQLDAVHRFMPGSRIERAGPVLHCQGTVVAEWRATGGDGAVAGTGLNVFELDADGRIAAATGLWRPPAGG